MNPHTPSYERPRRLPDTVHADGSRYARINDEPEIFVSASQNRRYALIMIC